MCKHLKNDLKKLAIGKTAAENPKIKGNHCLHSHCCLQSEQHGIWYS